MRKKILFFSILVLLLCGCTRIDTDKTKNYSNLVVNCLSKKAYTNDVNLGYKYYLPKGVKLKKNYDYNQVFLVNDVNMYMFVDVNSYYYNIKKNYLNDDIQSYYYEKINYDGKSGYIKINENNNRYYTKIVYNYSSIEFYCDYDELNKLITYSSIILNSVKYKRNIIKLIINDSYGEYSDIAYEIKKPEDASNDFSQYLEEYVQEDEDVEEKLPGE